MNVKNQFQATWSPSNQQTSFWSKSQVLHIVHLENYLVHILQSDGYHKSYLVPLKKDFLFHCWYISKRNYNKVTCYGRFSMGKQKLRLRKTWELFLLSKERCSSYALLYIYHILLGDWTTFEIMHNNLPNPGTLLRLALRQIFSSRR